MLLPPSKRTAPLGPSLVRRLFDARRPTSINLGLGEPSMPVSHELLDAGVARFRKARPGYTLNAGMLELRELIAAYHGLPHAGTPGNVVVTVGATGGLFATILAVADPGDEIIVCDPSFWVYRTIAELLGVRVVAVPLSEERGFTLDVARMAAAITPRTRAIIINSPSNPTGRIESERDLRALVDATESSGVWLISDEIYREHHYGATPPFSLGAVSDRAIVISALSKSCSMTGFRLGYVLAPDAIAKAIGATHQYNVSCAPAISQCLAIEAFSHPASMRVTLPQFTRQRAALLAALDAELPSLPYAAPEGGFFVFLDARSLGKGSLALAEELLAGADVVTVPGIAFGQASEGYLRISFCESEEKIGEGISRIARYLARA